MANIFRPEAGLHLTGVTKKVTVKVAPPMVQVLLNIVPTNPFVALTKDTTNTSVATTYRINSCPSINRYYRSSWC